ncbi:MAG: YebC/PmpR family DNA-binding transcriptional regulator [Candidatus Magasanikbacteria bacterium CG10_big_fil_rev_8_21_14_0_10_36_32]|uniref:Probable transcriptional regulatory protein COU29_01920 n=1 Tax=Candidatus Magasanikbacteria bacterium CG10_big_fil_rev_8_21_14_0_10_36_32 TaxID=1974646 RepID=A0A2M6W6U7_9BACT|nr:MAG: YebC/PmpR family DNA-binding transcriptional regulator [Candidatus Magasanikbacteria bacterium CG10_big_fil_rev_8_21_14_0_10_36_32]
MSGHSKWHNIQGRKGKQDALRSNLFSKFSKAISIAAKQGGGDMAINFSLRLAVDKAKAAGMPKDNIDRAIKKGTGELNDGTQVEEMLYEAYGPGGVAIMIRCLTDNKNRTVQEIKHIVSDKGGSFGNAGSVSWMFQQLGYILIEADKQPANREEFEMEMIDAGVEDIQEAEGGGLEIKTKTENFKKVVDKLREMNIETKESGLIWSAKDKVPISEEVQGKLEKLFGDLEDNDDVEDFYTNAE